MRISLKKALAGAAGVTVAAGILPVIAASPVSAAGVLEGPATLSPSTGGSSTPITLSLPVGAACDEDSAAGDWRTTSFMVPAGTDISTLPFDPTGPTPNSFGTYSTFRMPLWEVGGNPYVVRSTVNATPPDPTGPILPPNPLDFGVYSPGDVPAGAYEVGIACTDDTSVIQQYWSTKITVTANPSDPGPADISWTVGAIPSAPTVAATGGDLVVTGTVTPDASDSPAPTSYTVTLTPAGANPAPGGPVVVTAPASGAFTATDTDGVQYGTYDVTATSTNTTGTGAASAPVNVVVSPDARPAVTGFDSTVNGSDVTFTWTAPTGPAPTGYSLVITPDAGAPVTVALGAGATSHTETGLAVGNYSAVITPLHVSPFVGTPSGTEAFTVFPDSILVQNIEVSRPVGALVLTQVCGAYGALAGEAAQLGFPDGLPAAAAVNSSTVGAPTSGGSAPTLTAGGSDPDPVRSQYPYPTNPDGTSNASYPTHCGIDLGSAEFVRSGAGAGQFFAADGRMNQVTVVDTRDGDLGWNVVGQVSNFEAGPGKSFSGSQLGWTPVVTEDTGSFTDSLGNSYDQVTTAGAPVAQNSAVVDGLSSNRTLIQAAPFAAVSSTDSTGGLGTAIADARLKLLIPVTAQSGTYTATLTISTL